MRLTSLLGLLAPAVAAALPTNTTASPPKDEITINSVTTSGSGCPNGTVSVTISDDRTVVTLGFDQFQTYLGPSPRSPRGRRARGPARDDERRKTCLIRLNVNEPPGFTFAVLDATYHGFAQLDGGVTGSFASSYSFAESGGSSAATTASIFGGGGFANGTVFTQHSDIPTASVVRSPCGRNATLFIRTTIDLTSSNSSASGAITDDDATFAFTHQLHLGWDSGARCAS